MRQTRKLLSTAGAALALALGTNGMALAQGGHDHEDHQHPAVRHGGTLAPGGDYQFEVVFKKDGLAVYPHGPGVTPAAISRMSAQAFFLMPGASRYSEPYTLRPASGQAGPDASLALAVDLSKVPARGTKVTVRVFGLPDAVKPKAEFTVPFALAESAALTVTTATKADEPALARMKRCPVSGEELGSMGPPLKVARGESSTFLCCKGCLKKVEADPGKYLGAAAAPDAKADHKHRH